MKIALSQLPLPFFAFFVSMPLGEAAVIDVTPGVNNVQILQVVYTINGNDVVQNAEAVGVDFVGDTEVNLKSVRINKGGIIDLQHFNTAGAVVRNVNPDLVTISGTPGTGLRGLGVYDNGIVTPSTSGVAAFSTALAATTSNTDLRNFTYYDFLTKTPTLNVPDYDLLYVTAMKPEDYLLVSERWGNTYFEVTPLSSDGTPIAGTNVLRFGGASTSTGYSVYDWNSGYAAAGSAPTQAQAFSVASISKFFEGTLVAPGPVYGFRIDNDGEADTKMLVISNSPFNDNPPNPLLVPEPSVFLLSLAAGMCLLFARNRNHAGQ